MLDRLADRVQLRTSTVTPVQRVQPATAPAKREFRVGQEVRARIDEIQRNGVVKALIDEQPLLLRLPFHVSVGDTISLTVSARVPTLKFTMNEYPAAFAQTPALSDTARFITALLAESEKLPVTAAAPKGPPLLGASPLESAPLAAALRDALSASGMFYEAHQAQWVSAERPLAALFFEPQSRLPLTGGGQVDTPQRSPTESPPEARLSELPVHRDALPIVRQQLETLATGQVAWRGLVWNAQPMEWHVFEHEPEFTNAPHDTSWQTRIAISLPRLGDVTAALLIGKNGITINIHAAYPDTVSALERKRAALKTSLRATGFSPLAITIANTVESHEQC